MQTSSSGATQDQDHSTDYTKYKKDKDYNIIIDDYGSTSIPMAKVLKRNSSLFQNDVNPYILTSSITDDEVGSITSVSDINNKRSLMDDMKYIFMNDLPIVANTSSAVLGVSIFAMPWGYQQSGILLYEYIYSYSCSFFVF